MPLLIFASSQQLLGMIWTVVRFGKRRSRGANWLEVLTSRPSVPYIGWPYLCSAYHTSFEGHCRKDSLSVDSAPIDWPALGPLAPAEYVSMAQGLLHYSPA